MTKLGISTGIVLAVAGASCAVDAWAADTMPVTAVPVKGHTPGHSAYEIASGADRLLYIGDSAHHSVISVQKPDWTVEFDGDAPTAQASRRALLQRAADQNLRLYAVHFPYPGLGHVQARGDGFVWIKRKHYFDADRNPHWRANYWTSGRSAGGAGEDGAATGSR